MRGKFQALGAVLLAGWSLLGQAVHVAEYGSGQVLLYPYYTVQGGMDTLLSVVNTTTVGKALKVRFLEGRNSREVLSLNVYLSPRDAWVAALTRDAGGNAVLRTPDTSCTVPAITGDVAFSNASYTGYDRAGRGLDRAREGSIEIVEMGEINPTFDLPNPGGTPLSFLQAISHDFSTGLPANCAAVVAAWATGGAFRNAFGAELTLPKGGLVGTGSLIQVPEGIDYSYDPAALADVFGAAMHTASGDPAPSFGRAKPTSIHLADGIALTSTWSRGADAVSSVLMAETVLNEYVTEPVINAATDWVLSFPTWAHHVVRESDTLLATRPPFTAAFDDRAPAGPGASDTSLSDGDSRGACHQVAVSSKLRNGYNREGLSGNLFLIDFSAPLPERGFDLCWATNVLTIGSSASASGVLGSGNPVQMLTGSQAGWLDFALTEFPGAPLHRVTSINNNRYFGLPAIGFAVQRYFPGQVGSPAGNYGGLFMHKYHRRLDSTP